MAFSLQALLADESGFDGLAGVAEQAMRKHSEEARERLTQSLVGLLSEGETTVRSHVANLRTLRKQASLAKAQLDKIGRAYTYMAQTGNPMPFFKVTGNTHSAHAFCQNLGVPYPEADDKVWQVPSDFVEPKSE